MVLCQVLKDGAKIGITKKPISMRMERKRDVLTGHLTNHRVNRQVGLTEKC